MANNLQPGQIGISTKDLFAKIGELAIENELLHRQIESQGHQIMQQDGLLKDLQEVITQREEAKDVVPEPTEATDGTEDAFEEPVVAAAPLKTTRKAKTD